MHRTRRTLIAVAVAVAVVFGTAAAPLAVVEGAGAQEAPAGGDGDSQALVSLDVDVLRSDDKAVGATLAEVRANVEQQRAALRGAQDALAGAQDALAAAEAALADTRKRLDAVSVDTDLVVVDAFMSPPYEDAWESLVSDSLMDLTVKQWILDRKADAEAAALDRYAAAHAQLEAEEGKRRAAAEAAEAAAAEAEEALADVEAATGQEARFALEIDRRIDRNLAEADALEAIDPALAAQIRAREGELAAMLDELDDEVQAERARARAADLAAQADSVRYRKGIKPVPGGVAVVACPSGGSIEVAGDISRSVERLMADAADDGITLCGFGYRDPADQVAVRRANCGTSDYAVYEAPSSYCSPPTARPGTSMHEQGLAIDFTSGGESTISSGSAAYGWMSDHAADYGLYNLPGEPWHWSVDGK